jgi:hypothetical protein
VFRLPVNFRAAELLPPALARYVDSAHYLVDRVVTGQMFRRADARGFVRLKVDHLRRVVPSRVEPALRKLLIERQVLECDAHYVPGEMSRGYRLGPGYRTRIVRLPCEDDRVAERVRRAIRRLTHRSSVNPVDRHLKRWLRGLDFDAALALEAANQLEGTHLHLALVEEIRGGVVEYSRCRLGRVHTSVTRLPRTIRSTLRLGGSPLCQIDVANAQPLLLGLYLLPTQSGDPWTSLTHDNPSGGPDAPPITTCIAPSKSLKMTAATGFRLRDLLAEEHQRRYVELCEAGVLYEHLAGLMTPAVWSRDRVKRALLVALCGPDRWSAPVAAAFRRAFPTVVQVVRRAKRPDHARLARDLQRLESHLVIDRVCGRLMREHRDVPVVSVHDGLLTPPAYVDVVRNAMLTEFGRVGLAPTLKVTGPVGLGRGGGRAA